MMDSQLTLPAILGRAEELFNGINVNIDPEEVNKAIADAIIQSAIGKKLERVINQEVEKLSRSYNNPIEAGAAAGRTGNHYHYSGEVRGQDQGASGREGDGAVYRRTFRRALGVFQVAV
ncbi:MAG: hypothetical protein M3N00_07730 [Actinomycetota bacterium]|nr:hypothetical protein [Actinomycetota bacterium]